MKKSLKKFLPSLIAVKRITSTVPATAFNHADLEAAARTSLELGGFIQPPIVRRTGTELELTYEVISGHFQYHAACIACEIDYLAGETVVAYIMEPETEATIIQQLAVIPCNTPVESTPEPIAPEVATLTPEVEATTLPAPITQEIDSKPVTKPAVKKAASAPYLSLSFHKMSLNQLKEWAKKNGVKLQGDKRKKETYLNVLIAA
jgi:hypothetical protein